MLVNNLLRKTGYLRYIYQNELIDTASCQHDISHAYFNGLPRRKTFYYNYYVITHLNLLKIRNMLQINVDILPWFITFLIKGFQVLLIKLHSQRP